MTEKILNNLPKKSLGVFTPTNINFETSLTSYVSHCIDESVMFRWSTDARRIVDRFPFTKTVFFDNIGYKFLYHNMTPSKFPKVNEIYLNSHPGESLVVHRFSQRPNLNLYITSEYYNRYFGKWWDKNNPYIKEISDTDYNDIVESYLLEKPKY